jgi:hypothetical protein
MIVSNLPGPMEIIEPGKDALTFQAGEFTRLASCLEQLLIDNTLATTLARNGFEKAQFYNIKRVSSLITNSLLKFSDSNYY